MADPQFDVTAYRRAYFALCKSLGLDDDLRHAYNLAQVGKSSTTKWTVSNWRAAVAELQRRAGQNVEPSRPHIRGQRSAGRGQAVITPAQLEYISRLASQITWKNSCHTFIRSRLLNQFRRDHWDGALESLTGREASNVIAVLRHMVSVYAGEKA
jgi:hypothetical protein